MARKNKSEGNKETRIDKHLKKYVPFIIGLFVLIAFFVILYFIFQGLGTVRYQGLTFVKEKYGDIPIYRYTYMTKINETNVRTINVLLRGNPAQSKVPIDSDIFYPIGKNVYISINNTGLLNCDDSMISLSELSIFLLNNNIPLKAGTPDKAEAKSRNSTYITCASYPSSLTISLKAGNETKITKSGDLCYNMEVANCEILPSIEKFIVQSLVDAKKNNN